MPVAILIDPLGRSVALHDSTWRGHIVKGHPEMRMYRGLVESAITSPLEIRYSTTSADCRIYYVTGPRSGLLVAVVADVVAGLVKTAYLTRAMKGAREWP